MSSYHTASIVHNGEERHLLYIARVSSNQENTDPNLIRWLIEQNHWSPFEMIGACVEINTTRTIGRQILRHRSFSFQEFSGRYAAYAGLHDGLDIRFKGTNNRQGSQKGTEGQQRFATDIGQAVEFLAKGASDLYTQMLEGGVAPECARAVLPEGLVPTRMYMNGTLRSWVHYLRERMKINPKDGLPWAQREHYWIARSIYDQLGNTFPATWGALMAMSYIDTPDYDI